MNLQYAVDSRDKILGKMERHPRKDDRNDIRSTGKVLFRSNDWHVSFVEG